MSQRLLAYPGQRIRFTIQNLLSLSTAWVEGRIGGDEEADSDAEDSEDEESDEEEEAEDEEEVEVDPRTG